MPNDLPVPGDFQHLIEKREGKERRGNSSNTVDHDRREGRDRRTTNSDSVERFRPSDKPKRLGPYRCENCLTVVIHNQSKRALPPCQACGNSAEPWYVLIE